MSRLPKIYIILAAATLAVAGFFIWTKIPTPENSAAGVRHQPKVTTFIFGGDIMLSRNVDQEMEQVQDFTLPFAGIKAKTSTASLAFANLESPFSDRGAHYVAGSLTFDADPQAILGLQDAGFDVLSTSNNHSLDDGQYGIKYTDDLLANHNILPVGTGTNCHLGQIITKNNIRFGFLAYTYGTNTGLISSDICYATDLDILASDINTMRPKVDFLVVSTHMGVEYTRTPTDAQVAFAHAAVSAGADLVIGNHPHWVQPIEHYTSLDKKHQGWIFYAMGNLVFDQMWSQDTTQGLTATITFSAKGGSASGGKDTITLDSIQLDPVITENYCCPRFTDPDETISILSEINPLARTGNLMTNGEISSDWHDAVMPKN
ncbi:MAG TPA: CapA family protein [Patescibacteria group bacterium]|nr:CapA family protein [Patescibacteria group bacterium]